MSRLSDTIAEAISSTEKKAGQYDLHGIIQKAKPLLAEEDRDILLEESLSHRVRQAIKRHRSAKSSKGTGSLYASLFPDLFGGYAIDGRENIMKDTDELSIDEFDGLIVRRDKSVKDDIAHIRHLRRARDTVGPLWEVNSGWTFGEACRAYAARAKGPSSRRRKGSEDGRPAPPG